MDPLGVLLLLASVLLHTGLLVGIHRLLRFCTQHREDKVFFSYLRYRYKVPNIKVPNHKIPNNKVPNNEIPK